MHLKQYMRYQINFFGKWVTCSGALMGLSLFLRIFHYFGVNAITDFDTSTMVLHLAAPTLFSALYIYLLRGIRWNAPGMFGILGAVFCILLIIWNFSSADILRTVFSLVWYLLAAFVFLATTGGYMPTRFFGFLVFVIPFFLRVFLYDIPLPAVSDLFGECSDLCLIASVGVFPFVLVSGKKSETQEQ